LKCGITFAVPSTRIKTQGHNWGTRYYIQSTQMDCTTSIIKYGTISDNILRRNCLLQQVIEGKIKVGIEVTGRRGRRRRKLLGDLKERRGYSHLMEEALDRTMWRARFGRGFGPVVRHTSI
jgi:hypothetical protein